MRAVMCIGQREPFVLPKILSYCSGPEFIDDNVSTAVSSALRAPKVVDKPGGREIWYAHEDRYAGKIIEVTKGHALSLQKHERKKETMYLQSVKLLYHLNGTDFEMNPGQCITIRPGDVHRITALQDAGVLEVSTPALDDVIRLEDRYGRGS